MNIPNTLTILRVCLIPFFVFFMYMDSPRGAWLACLIFVLASLTDLLDGYLARKLNQITTFGKFMDPLADKLLVCTALISLTDLHRIPSWIVMIIVAREFIISGFRLIAAEKGVVIAASYWGKIKTTVQMIMVILMILNFGGFWVRVSQVFMWAALFLTVISLVDYMVRNRSVLADPGHKSSRE